MSTVNQQNITDVQQKREMLEKFIPLIKCKEILLLRIESILSPNILYFVWYCNKSILCCTIYHLL